MQMPSPRVVLFLLFLLLALSAGAQSEVWVPRQKLTASDGQARDRFGETLTIDGDTRVIGAQDEDELGLDSGAVYVYERDAAGNWVETVKLVLVNGYFGSAVSLDGDTLAINAASDDDLEGSVYIYERDPRIPDGWRVTAKIKSPDPTQMFFGGSATLQGDELYAPNGLDDTAGPSAGATYIFHRNAGGLDNWGHVETLTASDAGSSDNFGVLTIDGTTLAVGASRDNNENGQDAGSAYVSERDEGGVWVEVAKLLASDGQEGEGFGWPIAIEGDVLVVGVDGDDNNGHPAGSAYIFERLAPGQWVEVARITSSDGSHGDHFGEDVAIEQGRILIGAWGDDDQASAAGAVYVFERNESGTWVETAKLKAFDGGQSDNFGEMMVTDAGRLLVGAKGADDEAGIDVGAAYLFELDVPSALRLRLEAAVVEPGETLAFSMRLAYQEIRPLTAPLQCLIVDATGEIVASLLTAPRTLKPGDRVGSDYRFRVPETTKPGAYTLVVGLMIGEEPVIWDRQPFTVSE